MRSGLQLLAVLVTCAACLSEKVRYDDYEVYQLMPRTEKDVIQLARIAETNEYSFWTEPMVIDQPVNIMVAPQKKSQFEALLNTFNFKSKKIMDNVQALIDEQNGMQKSAPRNMEWKYYHELEEIYDWLDALEEEYPEVKTVVGGHSYEGRDIKGIEINFGKDLVGVVIEAGIHAREWISPAGTSWMINEILNSPSNSTFRQFNYLYFPVFNPDGYDYTWNFDRLWRKTRTPYGKCFGADPNRNWDVHWGEVGASGSPCSEIYAGPRYFSEKETSTMSRYLLSRAKERNNDIYISYHSYSQYLMYPWGYTTIPAPHASLWKKIGDAAVEDLKAVHGTNFKVGSISTIIYKTSGTSLEWYYDKLNSTISFVYEMRDTGSHGFLLPPEQIIPVGEEHLASLHRILVEYKKLKPIS